jgi:nucleoside-diphosphate-sugar epimerase
MEIKKSILIVGGQGFIGSHIAMQACDAGYQVTVLSLNQRGFSFAFPKQDSIEVLQANIVSLDSLQGQLSGKNFNYVVNCAGYINHQSFQSGGRTLIDQHFLGVVNLVQCLDRDSLECFIQIGSSDEYGDTPSPQKENSREAPISPYSFGKVATTHFLQMLFRTEQFPVVIFRLFLVFGPGQNNQRLLPQIINRCLQNKTFPTSAGRQYRDFCFIEDIAIGVLMGLLNPDVQGKVINLASGRPVKIRKIVENIQQLIGKGTPDFGAFPYRVGENMKLYANIDKARTLLGWSPETVWEEALKRTINYYQERLNCEII